MAENALHTIVTEVGEVFRPLQFLNSELKVTTLFKDLGYELPNEQNFAPLPSIVPQIQSIITKLEAFAAATNEDDQLDAIEGLMNEIEGTVNAIQNFEIEVANLNSSISGFATNAELDKLPRRFIDYLLINYTKSHHPGLYSILRIIALFDEQDLEADPSKFQPAIKLQVIEWERIPDYFSAPHEIFDQAYNWNTNFNSDKFISRLDDMVRAFLLPGGIYTQSANLQNALQNPDANLKELRTPIFQNGTWPDTLSQFGVSLTPAQTRDGLKKGFGIFPYVFGAANFDFELNETFEVELTMNSTLDAGLGIGIRPPFELSFIENILSSPQNAGTFLIELALRTRGNESNEYIIIGEANASRLSVKGTELKITALKDANKGDFGFEYSLDTLKIVIGGGEGDGFLQTVLPEEGITASFSMTLGYSIVKGFYFVGSGSFEIVVASHIQLGPLDINNLTLGFAPGTDGLGLTTAAGLKLELGPFVAVVEGLGLKSNLSFPENGGNLGPADLSFGFKPPTGIGLSLDASIVKGGGYLFFEPEEERYGGALELVIAEKISVVAIALITTRFPDGSKGFSLLLLISVEFSPGIALGMGFFLSGLGGMIGINRTVNTDALRAGVKQGSVDHILFPTDVVANIQRIITDLREFFPPQRDQFIIGLMAKLTWGVPTLLSVEFGIAIEFKSPVRLAILGVIKLVLPTEDEAIIRIQVNFIGVIDFDEGYLMFDASLFGSKILTFTLEGDMALRIFWGKQKEFLLSVGGFHPAYSPPAFLKVANMTRLTLNILSGNPSLTLTTYFAITSNTVQFGAQIDFYFKVSKFKVIGYFGFDVLFQFSPFRFIAGIRAGVEVKLGSTVLFAIQLAFELQGPTPWIANGTASFKILFIKISVKFSKTWGERREDILPGIPVLPKLLEALEQPRNWVGDLPSNKFLLTSMKKIDLEEGQILMHAVGTLTIRQTIMPLGMEISKFGNYTPVDIKSAFISSINIDGKNSSFKDVKDGFAPAEFKEMEDQDKLTAPSYKDEVSGAKIIATENLHLNYGINRIVNYEVRVSDYNRGSEQPYALYNPLRKDMLVDRQSLFRKMTKGGAVGKSELSQELKKQNFRNERAVNLQPENYVITNVADLSLFDSIDFNGGTKAEADDQLKKAIRNNPSLKDKIQVVNEFELA